MNLQGKRVWISGASTGLGLELAKQALQAGAAVLLSSSNPAKLAQAEEQCQQLLHPQPQLSTGDGLASDRILTLPLDVTRDSAVAEAINFIESKKLRIDILINNAGIGQNALSLDTEEAVERLLMEVNYWGCVRLTRALLPLMCTWGGGQIVVTSSVLGLFSIPLRSSYAASKHALQGYFSALASEYRRANIYVTLLCPGRIATPFALSSLRADGQPDSQAAGARADKGMTSGDCARLCWRAIAKRRLQAVVARSEWVAVLLARWSPNLYLRLLLWAMNKSKLRKKIIPVDPT